MILKTKSWLPFVLLTFVVATLFTAMPVDAWPDPWVPGIYIGYAEDGTDITPDCPYDYYGTFTGSENKRVWFHWEEELFENTHVSHYFQMWVWIGSGLDVGIGAYRNEYMYAEMWPALYEDDGGWGYDEHLSHQYTNRPADYPAWDDEYCALFVYRVNGSGSFHVRIFVNDS